MINGKLTQLFKDIVSNSMQEMFNQFNTSLESGKDKITVSIGNKSLPFRELLVNFGVKIGRLGNLEDGFIQKYLNSDKSTYDSQRFISQFENLFWDGLNDERDIHHEIKFSFENSNVYEEVDTISKKLSSAFKDLVDKYPQSFQKDKSSWIPLLIATTENDTIVTDCRFFDELDFFNDVDSNIFPLMIRKIDPITENGFIYDSNSELIDFDVLKKLYIEEISKNEYKNCETFSDLKTFKENFQKNVQNTTDKFIGPAEIDSAILSIALNVDEHLNINNNVQNIILNSYKKLGLIDYKNYLGVDKELFANNSSIINTLDKLINSNSDNKILLFIGNSQNGKDTIFNLFDSFIKDFHKEIKISCKISNDENTIYLNNVKCELKLTENPLNIKIELKDCYKLPKDVLERFNKELSIAILSEISFKDIATYENISIDIPHKIYFKELYDNLKNTQIAVSSIEK